METANELRRRFNRRFRTEFMKPTVAQGFGVLFLDFGTIILAILASEPLSTNGAIVDWSVYVVAIVVIGTRLRSFGNIVHECSHFGFMDNRDWNDFVGRLASTLLCYSYDCYCQGHMTHHAYTGDYEKDEDFADTKMYQFDEPITGSMLKTHLTRLITFQFFPYYTGKTVFTIEDRPLWVGFRLIYVGLILYSVVGVLLALPFASTVFWYWIVPYCTVLPIIGYLSDLFDHAGLIANEDEVDKSRNYPVSNKFLHWLFFPRDDSYHLTHHLFPMVPTKDLARCHEILVAESTYYAARPHTLTDWVRNYRFQKPSMIATTMNPAKGGGHV